jgi:uncharacterized membrane protein
MTPSAILSLFAPLDFLAVGLLLGSWFGIGLIVERPLGRRRSVTVMMSELRREWMRQFARRENRIFDSQILGGLRQGSAFFASTSLVAIGALLTMAGNVDLIGAVSQGVFGRGGSVEETQIKLLAVAAILIEGFLRFVWANRVFGYCAVAMAAVPEPGAPQAERMALRAAELNIRAAYNFNRGLRSIYFALAGLAWTLGPWPLVVATAICVANLLEREFASKPHRILREDRP